MIGDAPEIFVGREHRQPMVNAELGQESVDRADLHAGAATGIAQRRRVDVIVAVRHEEWHCGKSIQDLRARARPRKALQQLLQDKTGRKNIFAALDRAKESACLRRVGGRIASERERPHAGIDEQAQSRPRSVL